MENNDNEWMERKARALSVLRERLAGARERLRAIDERLLLYFDDLATHASADPDDADDRHNLYEVLCGVKFLRLLATYDFNDKKVQTVIRLREGVWRQDGRSWRYVNGGLKCPGTSGAQVYRWQPFQVFVLASVFGPMAWVNTEVEVGMKPELLPTEEERDGIVWDYRRLCTDFTYFAPRKTDKTGLAAFIQLVFFFLEDDNAECYCAANASSQSALLFNRTRQLIAQLDNGQRIRSTQTVIDWKDAYKSMRNSSVRPLSAGGKTKDGMFAQLCCADEFGSAPYANGKSDMLALVNVIQSSMGPRREPLTFTTTTAGTIQSGPFIEKLDALHRNLLDELAYAAGTATPSFESDRRLALCLEPDAWETDEEVILTKKSLRRKVNPMLGLIVQHASYDGWIDEAKSDPTKMPELVAKYFNHYQTARITEWVVRSQDVVRVQRDRRVTDCRFADGWQTFVGLDFSHGEDLFAITYLSVNMNPTAPMAGRFFADCEAWVTEETLHRSANRPLYEKWVEQGWLNVSPGKVFNPDLAVNELMRKTEQGVNLCYFGYDPAQSKYPINMLRAWLLTLGIDGAAVQEMVVPVAQTYMVFNGLIGELEYMLLEKEPWLHLSMSPLWSWEVGNVKIEESREGNRKILKSGVNSKVDNIHALVDALYCFDLSEGKMGG